MKTAENTSTYEGISTIYAKGASAYAKTPGLYVLASSNPGKIAEMREILSVYGINMTTKQELGVDIDVAETGDTFAENAALKATAICKASGLPAIADDSGLAVDALGGAPGLNTSSFGGEGLDSEGRYNYLLSIMDGVEQRGAKFVSTIVCAFPDGSLITAEGTCGGEIAPAPRGSSGFGYDPVFTPAGMDMTMAELPPGEKNKISHRGKALRQFTGLLQNRMSNIQ